MKTNKKALGTQRRIMDRKLQSWLPLRIEKQPPAGWLKAIRGALGISSRQLAQIVGVDMSAIIRLEEREPEGKVTVEMLNRAAQAMDCKVVYAIVPEMNTKASKQLWTVEQRRLPRIYFKKLSIRCASKIKALQTQRLSSII
ncbi:MAG: helix-turn-helix domain-containing protein [Bdellovibrionales bacterium]|nr:helix-turn-helix domain-containing protein [Bdellovibrionales bacterium]